MTIQPLFIFSVTRSGSTLTQRILGWHHEISTASESWILLPLLSPLRPRMAGEADWHASASRAISEFSCALPRGLADYQDEMRELALRLYTKAAEPGARYFLDKTPAYTFIVDQVLEVFPEGRFIFLWRSPLGILASMMSTWERGRWNLDAIGGELFDGLPRLVAAYERNQDRAVALRFEEVITGDADAFGRVMEYLEISFNPVALQGFSGVDLGGSMGDPTGVFDYPELSREPLVKWKQVINTPIRRAWTRRYLNWLGPDRIATMGYQLDDLLSSLDSVPLDARGSLADVRSLGEGLIREIARARMRRPHPSSSWRRLIG